MVCIDVFKTIAHNQEVCDNIIHRAKSRKRARGPLSRPPRHGQPRRRILGRLQLGVQKREGLGGHSQVDLLRRVRRDDPQRGRPRCLAPDSKPAKGGGQACLRRVSLLFGHAEPELDRVRTHVARVLVHLPRARPLGHTRFAWQAGRAAPAMPRRRGAATGGSRRRSAAAAPPGPRAAHASAPRCARAAAPAAAARRPACPPAHRTGPPSTR